MYYTHSINALYFSYMSIKLRREKKIAQWETWNYTWTLLIAPNYFTEFLCSPAPSLNHNHMWLLEVMGLPLSPSVPCLGHPTSFHLPLFIFQSKLGLQFPERPFPYPQSHLLCFMFLRTMPPYFSCTYRALLLNMYLYDPLNLAHPIDFRQVWKE